MSLLESLPERPLRTPELNRIGAADGVHCAHVRFESSHDHESPDVAIAQFVVFLDSGTAVGVHFDPEAREWHRVDGVDCDPSDEDDHLQAVEQLDDRLEELREDGRSYGQAVLAAATEVDQ